MAELVEKCLDKRKRDVEMEEKDIGDSMGTARLAKGNFLRKERR